MDCREDTIFSNYLLQLQMCDIQDSLKVAFLISSLIMTLSKRFVQNKRALSLIHVALGYLPSWFILFLSSELFYVQILPTPQSLQQGLNAITSSKCPLMEWAFSVLTTLQLLQFPLSLPLLQTALYHIYLGSSWLNPCTLWFWRAWGLV